MRQTCARTACNQGRTAQVGTRTVRRANLHSKDSLRKRCPRSFRCSPKTLVLKTGVHKTCQQRLQTDVSKMDYHDPCAKKKKTTEHRCGAVKNNVEIKPHRHAPQNCCTRFIMLHPLATSNISSFSFVGRKRYHQVPIKCRSRSTWPRALPFVSTSARMKEPSTHWTRVSRCQPLFDHDHLDRESLVLRRFACCCSCAEEHRRDSCNR